MRWFTSHPRIARLAITGLILVCMLALFEFSLRAIMGLGNPVIYDSNPIYGYRLLPDQEVSRFYGSDIRINNLGLRANEDWDDQVENKILFLGDSVTYGGSNVSNDELFSYLALRDLDGYKSGNAAVNAWGVANMHGLLVESEFLPASIYVTVLLEEDFYRGLTRLQGLPYWNRQPSSAIQELFYFSLYELSLNRYRHWQEFASSDDEMKIVETAVLMLKEMDDLIDSKGYLHLIFITPTREQALHNEGKDELIRFLLNKHDICVTYVLDVLDRMGLDERERQELFYDNYHLNRVGHSVYGEIVGNDLIELLAEDSAAGP